MTLCRFSLSHALHVFSRPWRYGVLSLALLAAPPIGCGGSTDTGNPPVIGQKMRLSASDGGVIVSGDPGAVPASARVDVVNTSTGESASTTARPDGSFEVELPGTLEDEYRVEASLGSQSWSTQLTSSSSGQPTANLSGLEFQLQSAEGFTLVANTTLRLSFGDGELGFRAGCNSYSGQYSLCDDRLCVTSLENTLEGCDPALHSQDEWLATFFTASPAVEQTGAQLTLTGDGARLVFLDSELADPDRPLTGRTWTIDSLIQGESTTSPTSTMPPTLFFAADGTFNAFGGCNMGGGTYTTQGQSLRVSANFNERGCDTSGSWAVEEHLLLMLFGELTYEIDGARLTIMNGEVARGVSATTE